MMVVKLTDVAKKAGVSATTVSRVINNYGYLSQKTIDKVQQAIKELNYQPNSLARSLQGKNTQLVGLVFPTMRVPFFAELVESLETKLFEKGYKVILCNSANNKEKEREYLRMLGANKVDGIIAGSHNLGIDEYENFELPIVSFDRFLAVGIPIVSGDNFQGGYLAAQTLLEDGCKKIAIFTGANNSNSPTNQRLNGYLHRMKEAALTPFTFRISSRYSARLKGLDIQKALQTEELDGIFCTDDFTAILTLQEAQKLGIKVPEQLKVIGYDGTQFVRESFPALTTVAQPIDDCATLLIELLCKRIKNKEQQLDDLYTLPIQLIKGTTA